MKGKQHSKSSELGLDFDIQPRNSYWLQCDNCVAEGQYHAGGAFSLLKTLFSL